MNQEQRLQDFKANADQVEQESWSRAFLTAQDLLKKGICEKFVANKCMLSLQTVKEIKDKIID